MSELLLLHLVLKQYKKERKKKKNPHRSVLSNLNLWHYSSSPKDVMAPLTSKGYTMSPSTNPGVSTNVTRLNFFCFEVEISADR